MPENFETKDLPEVDLQALKQGKCPWCLTRICDGSLVGDSERPYDFCPECGDRFYS